MGKSLLIATKGDIWLSLIITLMLEFMLSFETAPSTLILKKPSGGGGGRGGFASETDEGCNGREVKMAPL